MDKQEERHCDHEDVCHKLFYPKGYDIPYIKVGMPCPALGCENDTRTRYGQGECQACVEGFTVF